MIELLGAALILSLAGGATAAGVKLGVRYVDDKLRYERTASDPDKPIVLPLKRELRSQA